MRPLVISLSALLSLCLWLLLEGHAAGRPSAPPAQDAEPVARVDAPTPREALLERRVRTLEDQLAAASGDAAESTSPAKPRADQADEPAGCLDVLASRFQREVTRDAWTETRAAVLRTWVHDSEARGLVDRIECRGRTCRLEVDDMASGAHALMSLLLQRMPRQLKAVHVAHCADRRAMLYVLY